MPDSHRRPSGILCFSGCSTGFLYHSSVCVFLLDKTFTKQVFNGHVSRGVNSLSYPVSPEKTQQSGPDGQRRSQWHDYAVLSSLCRHAHASERWCAGGPLLPLKALYPVSRERAHDEGNGLPKLRRVSAGFSSKRVETPALLCQVSPIPMLSCVGKSQSRWPHSGHAPETSQNRRR